MIDRFNKSGVLQAHQVDETAYDLHHADPATGLTQLGRSQDLHGRSDDGDWYPIWVRTGDLPDAV